MQELDNGRMNELIWVPLNKLRNNENKRSSGIKLILFYGFKNIYKIKNTTIKFILPIIVLVILSSL